MLIGNDAFEEADITGITRPCTKHNYLVKDVKDLASTIKQAFHLARTGRPGPVVVDLPKDVIAATTEFSYPSKIKMRSYNPTYQGHPANQAGGKLMAGAQKPLIYAGGGVITLQRLQRAHGFGSEALHARHHDPHGVWAASRDSPPSSGHAGNARYLSRPTWR